MDTLKLNKWKVIIISFFLALFFINRECKKNEEEMLRQNIIADKNCYNDTIIKPHDEGYLFIYLYGKYKQKNLKKLKKIEQIRGGTKIADFHYIINNDDKSRLIHIEDTISLRTRDSLIFTFSDNEKIILREFRNGGTYGSKKFLGCEWSYCVHGQDTIVLEAGEIRIFK